MPVKNTLIYHFIAAILVVLAVKTSVLWIVVLTGYLAFVIVKMKIPRPVLLLFTTVFFICFGWFYQVEDRQYDQIEGVVESVDGNKAVVATALTKVLVYFEDAEFDNDDRIRMDLASFSSVPYKNPGGFDYAQYLKTQGISQVAWCEAVEVMERRAGLKDFLASRFQGDTPVDSYSKMFILGIKDENIDATRMVELSIIHLFALSGMHLDYLKELIKKLLGFFVGRTHMDIASNIIIGVYLLNIPLNLAFTRAFGVGLFWWLFKDRFNKLDCLGLVGIAFILKNPYVIYSLSFIFSFAIYLILLLIGNFKFSDAILYLGSVPLILAVNYRLNLVGMVLAAIIGPFVKWFYLVILVNALMGGALDSAVVLFIRVFENILTLGSTMSLYLNFGRPGEVFIGIYYFHYLLLIARLSGNLPIRRDIARLIGLALGYSLFLMFSPVGKVVMIDVGQGDCFLVKQPFNRGNILIDTGGNISFDLAKNVTVPYLHSLGVFNLDCVILSHNDYDHSGAYESLANLIPIGETVREYQGELVVGDLALEILDLPDYGDKNDNSLVIHTIINDLGYLFLGDVSKEVENTIVASYGQLEVDVLKVSHHGSNTATSETLLQAFKPRLALISVGLDNPYNHPSFQVTGLLESYGVKIQRTDRNGALEIGYLPGSRNYLFPYLK